MFISLYYCCMAIIPPYLKNGDTIGIVCPSGFMAFEKAETCMEVLQLWGYQIKVGKTLGSQFNYFSGTDEERLADLQNMMDDETVDAVFFGRGGYGLSRIIDKINFEKFVKNPKWLIGYSDITLLHAHLFSRYNIASLHAPMAAAFNDDGYKNEYIDSLKNAISGGESLYKCETHRYNKPGNATGVLFGGNLSLITHAIGTPSDVDTTDKILFLEDIGEYIYALDRMLHQLKRSGKFAKPAAIIFGSFTDMKETTIPFGNTTEEVLLDAIKDLNIPICFNFPVGHTDENYALKIGVKYNLIVDAAGVTLQEL